VGVNDMNVNLGTFFDKFVADLLKSGLYQSQSEILREGLRLLKEREDIKKIRLQELRQEINIGLKQIEEGQCTEYDEKSLEDLFHDIKLKGRKKLGTQKRKRSA
jgi:antitoxin ParD1/3/4